MGSEVLTRRKQLLLSNLLDSSLKHTGHVTQYSVQVAFNNERAHCKLGACSLCSPWEAVSALAHESYSTPREWLCISLLKSEALSTHSSNFVRSTLNSICTSHVISQFPISLVSSADLSGVSFHHFSHWWKYHRASDSRPTPKKKSSQVTEPFRLKWTQVPV